MNYYKLYFNASELGFIPQDNGMIGRYFVDAPNSLRHFAYNDQMKDLWVPEGMKLRYKSKFTDFLCFTQISHPYLIISERFLKLISAFRLPKHQFFPFNVSKRDKLVPYNIFISKQYLAEYIDFDHSDFHTYCFNSSQGPTDRKPISINNAEEYWSILNNTLSPYYLGASKVELNTSVIEYDLFRLPRGLGGPHYFVSETFVEAVKQAGLTGMSFPPFDGK